MKSILSHSATKTGVYLVTGYRGVGKTSFVNRVLNEITAYTGVGKKYPRYFRIFFPLLFMPFIDVFKSFDVSLILFYLLLVLSTLSFLYLFFTDSSLTNTNKKEKKLKPILFALTNIFFIENETSGIKKFRIILQDFVLLSIIQLIFLGLNGVFSFKQNNTRFSVYISLFIILLLINAILAKLKMNKRRARKEKKKENIILAKKLWNAIENVGHAIKKFVNYSQRVNIKLNLGYDKLKEIDILRLIAKNMSTTYQREINKFSVPILSFKLAILLLLFFTVGTLYYLSPINGINQIIKNEIYLINYFPSQGDYLSKSVSIFEDSLLHDYNKLTTSDFLGELRKDIPNDSIHYREMQAVITVYIQKLTVPADLFVAITYKKVRENLPVPLNYLRDIRIRNMFRTGNNVKEDFTLIPKKIDYLFWAYFWGGWLLFIALSRSKVFGWTTQYQIIKKLRTLNDTIEAQVTQEKIRNIASEEKWLNFFYSNRKSKAYPIADEREIEKQLIEIFEDIERTAPFVKRLEFIFVLDELDKIDPNVNINIMQKEAEQDIHAKDESSFNSNGIRNRQQTILKILSNLKHFLTTAKAKFIFIAGREMFDASLADVSDRHSFIGSIFNEVIYVESFLKDPLDKKFSDITSMTETYICQFLFPTEIKVDEYTLKQYNSYLIKEYKNGHEPLPENEKIRIREIEKIIFTLSNFITYLTYRSNGAPKKITMLFEEYVHNVHRHELGYNDKNLCVTRNSNNLHLVFGYYDQYTFGMTTYLITPFFLSVHKAIKDYGDKLLVSSSFLVDHLYKFHRVGFSWRNLELTPEIIDINKAPQLRELIGTIIHFLSKTHIQVIDSGLYNFKFNKKISGEIAFLSKINEQESAAFNFTLDESLTVKRHYKRVLREIELAYKPYFSNSRPEFIRSISFVHMILGDLYFYDEEYDNAIIEYMEAVQLFDKSAFENLSFELFVLMVRNTLKLGVAFEKKKTFDSAFMVYGKLASRITKMREIKKDDVDNDSIFNAIENNEQSLKQYLEEGSFNIKKEYLYFRISVIEGLRLMYQPYVAKLQILEKTTNLGITRKDLDRLEREFKFLLPDFIGAEHSYVEAEFWNKVGDIIFYKNGLVEENNPVSSNVLDKRCCLKADRYCSQNLSVSNISSKALKTPCTACEYYQKSLRLLAFGFIGIKQEEIDCKEEDERSLELMCKILLFLERERDSGWSETVLQLMAKVLSDIGDTFLSCATLENDKISNNYLSALFEAISEDKYKNKVEKIRDYFKVKPNYDKRLNKLEEALLYYYLSSAYYRRVGNHREYSFQYIKILYVLNEYLSVDKKNISVQKFGQNLEGLEKNVISPAIRGLYRTYESTHRLEIEKYKDIFGGNDHSDAVFSNQSLNWDLREVFTIHNEIRLKIERKDGILKNEFLHRRLTHSTSTVNSMYNRIIELMYHTHVNFEACKKIGIFTSKENGQGWELNMNFNIPVDKNEFIESVLLKQDKAQIEIIEHFITDSIFSFMEIIKCCKIFGVSYNVNHSYLASTHDKLAFWCECYEEFVSSIEDTKRQDKIKKTLDRLIGEDNIQNISTEYHKEMALYHYRQAIETHREGRAYKLMIEDMYYLNDDFNDTLYHFCAALERYRLNSGKIYSRIDTLGKQLKKSILYNIDSYFSS